MMKTLSTMVILVLCTQVQAQVLFELKVGKYWRYAVSGEKQHEVKNYIAKSKIINGREWFQLIEYGEKFWISNSSEGQLEAENLNETEAENTSDLGVSIIFKFPAEVGDSWKTYFGTHTKYIGLKTISVPAGTFTCHMYHMDLRGNDFSNTCIAEGVGVVYNESRLNNQTKEISKLIEYGN